MDRLQHTAEVVDDAASVTLGDELSMTTTEREESCAHVFELSGTSATL